MNQKIPIYRAKKIDNDEYVIFNSFYEYENKYYAINKIINQTIDGWFTNVMIPLTYKIDLTTISIHFPDMIDSQGNKIFASLSEDGKGGDILFDMEYEFTLIFDDLKFKLEGLYSNTEINEYDKFTNFDSIGVQE